MRHIAQERMANIVVPPISPILPSILGNPHSDHSWGGPRIGRWFCACVVNAKSVSAMTGAPRLSGISPTVLGATGVAQVTEWRDPCASVLARHARVKDVHQKAERLAVAAVRDAFDHLPTFAHVIRTCLSL